MFAVLLSWSPPAERQIGSFLPGRAVAKLPPGLFTFARKVNAYKQIPTDY